MSRCLDYLGLAVLGGALFWPLVLHPDSVLYSDYSDFLAMHLPAKKCLARHYREDGQLPLWCPERFSGAPFVHDIQLAAFYPPHWPILMIDEDQIGPYLSFLVLFHVIVAGWGAYTYARFSELGRAGAWVAGIGTMFAGRWLLTTLLGGHYIALGVAWLPWIMWTFEKAMRRDGLYWSTWSALVVALVFLSTHPQWILYCGLVVLLWTMPIGSGTRGWLRWAGFGVWSVGLALALASVQLLPTFEAIRLSGRSGGVETSGFLMQAMMTLQAIVGPALTDAHPSLAWEERGGLGFLWLALAITAPVLRPTAAIRTRAIVTAILIIYALGGALLLHKLPVFGWFRQPARMFVVLGFPMAYLAGVSADALLSGRVEATVCLTARRVYAGTALIVGFLAGSHAWQIYREGFGLVRHAYWLTLIATAPALFLLFTRAPRHATVLVVILLIDAWALVGPAVDSRPEREVYPRNEIVEFLRGKDGRVLMVDDPDTPINPLGTGTPLALLHGIESVRGYAPLDVLRYKEYLQFLGDASDPLHSLDHPLTFPIVGDVPIKVPALANLLNIRYVVQPANRPFPPGSWRVVGRDDRPRAYDCVGGGVREMRPYIILENQDVMPRAWVVPKSAAMNGDVLAALKATPFREVVLTREAKTLDGGQRKEARILRRRPNRIDVDVAGAAPGFLVLSEIAFPGWRCEVDGEPTPILEGDYLFRAVELPGAARRVSFVFAPRSLEIGKAVSAAAMLVAALVLLFFRPRRLLNELRVEAVNAPSSASP